MSSGKSPLRRWMKTLQGRKGARWLGWSRWGRSSAIALVWSASLFLAQVGRAAPGLPEGGGTGVARPVTIALLAPPESLNPLLDADQYGTDIDRLLYRTLLTETPSLRLVPNLARTWHESDHGLVYTYSLTDDGRWTDGRPVTAHDVVWTLDAFRNPSDGSPAQGQFSDVKSVSAQGSYTVVVHLKKPWAPWNTVMAETPILPGHALAKVSGAKTIVESPILNTSLITDGPYRLKTWQRRSGTVILEASHVDPNAPPTEIPVVIFRVIADPGEALLALKAGRVQVAPVPVGAWRRVANLPRSAGVRVVATPELGTTFIGFNLEDPLFQNPVVRRALNLGVNRQAILRTAYGGLGQVPNGPLPRASWAYDPRVKPLPYDPKKARAMLLGLGFRPGAGGILTKGHTRLAFALAYARGTPELSQAVTVVARDLHRIGVQVTLLPMQFGALNGLAEAGKFDAIAEGWAYGPDPDLTSILGGKAAFPPRGLDVTRYTDPVVTRLLAAEAKSSSRARRKAIFARLTTALLQNPPYIPLVCGESLTAVSTSLVGYVGNPAGPDFYRVQDWRWLPTSHELR